MKFRNVAKWTTDLENHKTDDDYDYSLFVKRFIFEFTDFQLYLFYIGIYQRHIGLLRVNLVSLFMIDEVRRVACEVLLPLFLQNKDKLEEEVKLKIKRSLSINTSNSQKSDDDKAN